MLKFQYFGHLILRADSLKKTLMLGKIEGRRRRGQQRMRWLNGVTDSMDILHAKNLNLEEAKNLDLRQFFLKHTNMCLTSSFIIGSIRQSFWQEKKSHPFKSHYVWRLTGGGNGHLLQNPCLDNAMDRGTWSATVCKQSHMNERLMMPGD